MLFLDEPTVGLDPRIRYELIDVIGGLRARFGATVLLTTHYLDEAERLCDRVGIMHAGRIVALDRPATLLAALGDQVLELRVDSRSDRRARASAQPRRRWRRLVRGRRDADDPGARPVG